MIRFFISAVFVVHFLFIGWYITAKHLGIPGEELVSEYIQPYCPQEWEMFAPPPEVNTRLLYRYVIFKNGRADTSAFKEILNPLYKRQVKKEYSLSRLSYYLFNCTQNIYKNYEYMLEHLPDSVKVSNYEQLRAYTNQFMSKSYSHQSILKHGSLVLTAHYSTDKYDSVYFSYHILDEAIPEYKNRFTRKQGSDSALTFAWNSNFCKLKI
jgi:hypothetical protein